MDYQIKKVKKIFAESIALGHTMHTSRESCYFCIRAEFAKEILDIMPTESGEKNPKTP